MATVVWLRLTAAAVLLMASPVSGQERVNVDMGGRGCYNNEQLLVTDNQVYKLYAEYRFNLEQSQDHCDVSLRAAQPNRRLRYYVTEVSFFDCGISISIFDNPNSQNIAKRTITCNDNKEGILRGISSHDQIKFSLRKESSQSAAYKFQITVTTDNGPDIDFEKNDSEFYEAPLDTGAIVGIAIAGAILMIALVGLAIYCCLKNRMENMKYAEASEAQSAPSVFTSGTSQVMFAGAGAGPHRSGGGGGKYGSMEDVRSSTSSADRANNIYSNKGYQADADEKRFNRQGSGRREKGRGEGGHYNAAYDESDAVRGGHLSRRDSGRGGGAKYDKKKNYSRNEEYEMSKVSKVPNGILKTRSKSPNRSHSSTEGSTVDSNALVHGYSQSTHAHPNIHHVPVLERTRSRSRSRGASSHRSGSAGRSRSGSVGKSAGKEVKAAPSTRQYNDMSHFLDKPKQSGSSHRPRSRSGSLGRRARSDSRTSDNERASEVSFAPSGVSSKKTGGKRVHIQSVESDI